MKEKTIQTEVDNLVSLVQEEERISVKEAAKKLNMPISTIREWASFLEEERIINIEYKFTTPFLVKRKLTQKELEQIEGNIREEKDIFERKSESTLNYLNKLETEVDFLKDLFFDLEKHFNKRLSDVKKEFIELKKAEEEKEKLNKQVIESKQRFIKNVADINKKLLKEQVNYKSVYDILYNQTEMESQILTIQKNEIDFIKKTDKILDQKLKELKRAIDKKKSSEFRKKDKIKREVESNLHALEKKYQKLRKYLDAKRTDVEELLKENQEQEKEIESLKKEVLSKIKRSSLNLDKTTTEIKEVPKKLKLFMSKKDNILKLLNGISYNEKMLKEKLSDLMKRGSALNLVGDSSNVMAEIKELEEGLKTISRKRTLFESEIKKIFGLLRL